MLSTVKMALISAIPLEVINFFVVGYPADPHSVSTASQYPAIALQWYLFHLPGIVASDRIVFLREHSRLDSLVLFIAGFVDTTIFLAAALWTVHLAFTAFHKQPTLTHPAVPSSRS
jgi:hypothetical protein